MREVSSPESVGVGPSELKSLSHDKASEYLVEPVPVLWLTYDEIFQLRILQHSLRTMSQQLKSTSIHTELSGLTLALKDIAL